ncbi:hypothetical protein ACVWW4_003986 [Bradyrhizobium sp. LB7.1]
MITATLALSGASSRVAPPKKLKAALCPAIQSPSCSVHVASANDKLDAPMTATKMCASRTSPVLRSTTGTVSPA